MMASMGRRVDLNIRSQNARINGAQVAFVIAMRARASCGLATLLFLCLLSGAGCGSDNDATGTGGAPGAGRSGSAGTGASFPCAGPSIASSGDAGEGGGAGQTGQVDQTLPAVSCVNGQSFCYVLAGRSVNPGGGTVYIPECRSFSGSATECATNATCACFCSRFGCEDQCRCEESNGIATVTCDQI
jgi:hypothetical protein